MRLHLKKIFFLFTFCFFLFSKLPLIYAQETDISDSETFILTNENSSLTDEILSTEENINIKGEEFQEATSFSDFIHSIDFVMQAEPGINFNQFKTDSEGKIISAPSPIIYPITLGILWPNYTFIATQPSVSFFMQHHLFADDKALPAEIENRTTTTLSFMTNIPLVVTLFIKQNRIQLSGGIAGLLQFGLLSAGVSENDYGTLGSAKADVDAINNYFWSDLHWLYFSTGFSWLYTFENKVKLGPTFNAYIPVGTLINNQSIHGLIVSVGVKICR